MIRIGLAACVISLAGCTVSGSMPSNAELWADPDTKLYVSPPCKARDPVRYASFTQPIRNGDVKASWDAWRTDKSVARFAPEPRCRDARFNPPRGLAAGPSGGFTETRTIFQKSTRWNADGTWNW